MLHRPLSLFSVFAFLALFLAGFPAAAGAHTLVLARDGAVDNTPARTAASAPASVSRALPGEPAFAPGRLLVKFRSGAEPSVNPNGLLHTGRPVLDRLLVDQGVLDATPLLHLSPALQATILGQTLADAGLTSVYKLVLAPGSDVLKAAEALAADPGVEYAEPDYLAYAADTVPNDPLFPGQWALDQIEAPAAWDVITGTPTVVIAVLDTGIDVDHPDLAGRLWANPGEAPGNGLDDDGNGYVDDVRGWNFIADTNEVDDDDGHGTRVAGAAVAETDNNAGIAGVCWNCRLMPVKVMQAGGVANYSDVALGIIYAAAKGAEVINLSLGGYANSNTLRQAIEIAADTSVVVGAAGDDHSSTLFYPAAYPDVLAVGGTTATDGRASFSNYGDWVDVAAPAVAITTTLNGGGYGPASGTSLSAPLASGLVGLIWTQHPGWSAALIRAQVLHTTDALPGTQLGNGRIDAASAVTQTPHPLLSIASTAVNGDPLGRPTPGQQATLAVTLGNDWLDAAGVAGELSSADPYVTVLTSTASFDDISAGGMASGSPIYAFDVAPGAGYNHPIPFTLDLVANGGAYTVTLPLTITTRSANQNVGGTIVTDTTWTNDKTYIVQNNVGVAPGITLTIQPGTQIRFNGNYSLNVGGTLIADGTEAQPIRFMSNTGGTWGRIYFDNASVDATADVSGTYQSGNLLCWVIVEDAGQGVGCNSATPYLSHLALDGGGVSCTPGSTMLWVQDSTLAGGLTVGGSGQVWRNTVITGDVSLSGQATVRENAVNGAISTGNNSLVQDNTATATISAPGASIILENAISFGGISTGDSAVVLENHMIGGDLSAGSFSGVMTNTVRSGSVSVGSGSEVLGNDVEGATGWGISASGSGVTLSHNRLVACANGMNVGNGLVQGNLIANSHGIGLQVSGSTTVISNTLTGNQGNAVVIASGAPAIHGNNMEFNRGDYDLVNNTANSINASGNWWGTTDSAVIDNRIYDFLDDYGKGQVAYTPALTGPVQTAPAYLRSVTLTPASPVGIETVQFDLLFSRPMEPSAIPNLSFFTARRDTWTDYPIYTTFLASAIDHQGVRWFGTTSGVFRFDGQQWTQFTTGNSGLPGNYVPAVAIDRDGSLWFGTDAGAAHLDGTQWTVYSHANSGLPDDRVLAVAIDSDGSYWFATVPDWTNGWITLSHFDGLDWTHYNHMGGSYMGAMALDQDGTMWGINGLAWPGMDSTGDGIWHFDHASVIAQYGPGNSPIPSNYAKSMAIALDGDKWFGFRIGSRDGAVAQFDGTTWTSYSAPGMVNTIAVDPYGIKWFGYIDNSSTGGIVRLEGTTQRVFPLSQPVNTILIDEQQDKWVGTNFGISKLHGGLDYVVPDNPAWVSPTHFRASTDLNALIPRDTYTLTVGSALGTDGLDIAPNLAYSFTIDYIGDPDTETPSAPIVRACASPLTTTLSAQWTVPATQTVGLYRYAVGTAPGLHDVTTWITTTLTSVTRSNLNLLPGQTYYLSVRARNTGGIWSDPGASNGVVAGAGGCPGAEFSAAPRSGMSPLEVTFAAETTGTITSYLWSFGDGATGTLPGPVHAYWAPGAYTITLDVFGPGGWTTVNKDEYITVVPDTVPPTGSLTVAGGAPHVPDATVDLTVSAADPSGLDAMRFSNDGAAYSSWIPYAGSYPWALAPGDGPKFVYAQVRDLPGNVATYTDTVTLDATPPTATVLALPAFVGTATFTVTWTGTDLYAGLASFDVQAREGTGGAWTDWFSYTTQTAAPFTGVHGQAYYFRARARDTLGNLGAYAAGGDAHTTVDLVPPDGSLLLDGGALYANSPAVTLTLSAADLSGVAAFQVSDDGLSYSEWFSYTTAYSWTLVPGDGMKTVYARFRDLVGHESEPVTDTIILDTTPPQGTVTLNDAAEYTNSQAAALTLDAVDLHGIAGMAFSNDGQGFTGWLTYTISYSWTLPAGDGAKTVYARFRDPAGNTVTASDTITLDMTSPAGVLMVAGGATYAPSPSVLLYSEVDDAFSLSEMQFSNDEMTYSTWLPFEAVYTWTLSSGDGDKTVFGRYRDAAGNESDVISDTIVLDTHPPVGSVVLNSGESYANVTVVTLSLSAIDLSGVAAFQASNDGLSYSEWFSYTTAYSWTLVPSDGMKTVYAHFRDLVGHESEPVTDTILLHTEPPSGALLIADGAWATPYPSVTVAITASDGLGVADMCLANDDEPCGSWEPFVPSRPWVLRLVDGTRTVQAQVRDLAGNTTVLTDSILLDTTPPETTAAPAGVPGSHGWWRSPVQVSLTAVDATSGVDETRYRTDGGSWLVYTIPFSLSPDGLHTVDYASVDLVGNQEVSHSLDVPIDTAPPTTTASLSGTPGNGGWYISEVQVSLAAEDATSGVDMISYRVDGGAWQPSTAPITVSDGIHIVDYRSLDLAGNEEAVQGVTVQVDSVPPIAAVNPLTPYQTHLTFTVSWAGDDPLSGAASFNVQARDGDGAWTDWLSNTTALSATFTGLDGHIFSFRARARDGAGNIGEYAPGGDVSTRVDTTRPEGEIGINGVATHTTSRDVTLVLLANGESQMAFSEDGQQFGAWEPFAPTRAYQLPAGDGLKMLWVRYCCDLTGHTRDYSDTITLNTSIPGDVGLTIDDDAPLTDQVTVTLTLKAPAAARDMMISNSSRFVAAEWEPYAITRTWVLAYYPGVEVYQVYGRFRSVDGSAGERYDDIITLHLDEPPPPIDSTPPNGSVVIDAGAGLTSDPDVVLDVLAADNPGGVGVEWVYFREWKYDPFMVQWVPVRSSGWLPYADSLPWALAEGTGVKYVGAWFADGANNVSNPVVVDDIDLVMPGDLISETEVTQYRQTFETGETVTVTLVVTSGDADLYIWRPGSIAYPDYWSNLPGTATEQLVFTAVEGEYLIEVHGYASSVYALEIDSSGVGGGGLRKAQGLPMMRGSLASAKPLPPHPLVVTRPGQADWPVAPKWRVYLPVILRQH